MYTSNKILCRNKRGTKAFRMWYRTEEPPKKPNSNGNKKKLPAELNWFGMRLGKFGVKFPPTGAEGADWDWERELNTQDEWEQRESNALEKEKNKEI